MTEKEIRISLMSERIVEELENLNIDTSINGYGEDYWCEMLEGLNTFGKITIQDHNKNYVDVSWDCDKNNIEEWEVRVKEQ